MSIYTASFVNIVKNKILLMKKLIKTVFAICIGMSVVLSSQAQKNSIELGLGGLAVGAINLRYERLITPKSGLQITIAPITPKSWNPEEISGEDWSDISFEKTKFNGIAIIPEYRFYFGQGEGMRGFYVAPYLRYTNYGFNSTGTIEAEPGKASLRLSSFGAGIGVGAQWIIGDHFTIDWNIMGIGGDAYNLRAKMEADDPDYNMLEFANDFLEELEMNNDEVPIDLTDIANTVELNKFRFNIPFGLVGFRAGISVGYAF
jgi:hypothetical protein